MCLQSIAVKLRLLGHKVEELLGGGRVIGPSLDEADKLLEGKDLLIVTISESNHIEVSSAERASGLNIPVAVYAPGNGAYLRDSAQPLRKFCKLLLLGNEADQIGARGLFEKTQVLTVGNMLHEEAYPTISQTESRIQLGAQTKERVIFVPGDKSLSINWPLLHSVIVAAHEKEILRLNPVIVFGIHPGDPNFHSCYTEAMHLSHRIRVLIKKTDEMSGKEIVPGSNLIVTAGSTLGEIAAYQRKPVIGFFYDCLRENNGSLPPVWDLAARGAALVVRDGSIETLSGFIKVLLSPLGCKQLVRAQERNYPSPPRPGSTAECVANTIETFFFKK